MRSPADRFVGRQREVVDLTAALEHSNLVTVVGPPGVGKTRLALEVAANSSSEVVVVELAPVTEPSGVVGALASALGVKQCNDVVLEESITVSLAGRHVLVVLDNCEHLIESCRALATLCAPTGAQLLATSREPLGLRTEVTYRLTPLSVPPPEAVDPSTMETFGSVALFVERATLANPGFVLNATNAFAVAEVCRRLDGIPLAIELAAARVNLLTAEQLASMLAERFDVLGNTSASGVRPHQTLEAAVAWSYDLLPKPEQVLLRRLSVFTGATASAAEDVCSGTGLLPDEVSSLLAQLSARSLLVVERKGREVRYRQLEAVRRFVGERLSGAHEAVEARDRHARWAIALAERAEPELTGPDQDAWLYLLDTEADNLRAALSWLIRDEQAEPALRLAGALTLWWRANGRLEEGRDLILGALRLDKMIDSSEVLAKAFWGGGYLDYILGNRLKNWALCEHSMEYARHANDDFYLARALLTLAASRIADGEDTVDNLRALEESCRLAQGRDSWCLAHALALRGSCVARSLGEGVEGRRLVEEAVAVARDAGDTQSLLYALGCLTILAAQSPSPSPSGGLTDIVEEALVLCHDRPYERAAALLHLGRLKVDEGDWPGAQAALEESAVAFHRLGNPDPAWEAWVAQARLARAQGDSERARRLLLDAQASLKRRRLVAGEVLVELAYLAVEEGHLSTAQDLATRAVDSARVTPVPGDVVRSLLCQAVVSRVLGRLDDAISVATEALDIARYGQNTRLIVDCAVAVCDSAAARGDTFVDTLGAELGTEGPEPSLEEAAALAGRVLRHLVGPGHSPGAGAPGWRTKELTPAELSIADLVAEGLTNREISRRLAISPHTVRGHVSQIFAKLAVATRTELGAQLGGGTTSALPPESDLSPPPAPVPVSLEEFLRRFADDEACLDWLWRARYSADGVHAHCPRCDAERSFHRYASPDNYRRWSCQRCTFQFWPTVGTVLQASTTPLRHWLYATYLMVATEGALPAKQLQREIGVSYKAAWRMANLIRTQIVPGDVESAQSV